MAEPSLAELGIRLAALEREVRELRTRIAELERRGEAQPQHPIDRTAVREKAVFDWQGPR